MSKEKLSLLMDVAALSLLGSCSPNATSTSSSSFSSESSNSIASSVDPYAAPEAGEKSQIYQKRAFPRLHRGMTLHLEDYVGVVPGTKESSDATSFKTYIMSGDSGSAGYIYGGEGNSNDLVLSQPGSLVFDVEANGVTATFEVSVGESDDFTAFLASLSKVTTNYVADMMTYDEDGNEKILQKIYRGQNYIYNETYHKGYLLSKKDDNIYSFALPSSTSGQTDLSIDVSPAGDKSGYNSTFVNLNAITSSGTDWSYSPMLASNAALKKFKYAYNASSTLVRRVFKSLYILGNYYTVGSAKYYPYMVMGSYQNNELCLLPIMANSSATAYVYFNEVRLSMIDEVNVKACSGYVDGYLAPTPADMSEIVAGLKRCSTLMNYTITPTVSFIGANGKVLSNHSPYMTTFEPLTNAYVRKITKTAYWGENFAGVGSDVKTGGLWCTNNKTYRFLEDPQGSGKYSVTGEYKQAGADSSYPTWWSYTNMQPYVTTLAVSTSDVAASYSSYDETTGIYTTPCSLEADQNILKGLVGFGYYWYIPLQEPYITLLESSSYMTWKLAYDENKVLSEMDYTIYMTYPQSLYPALDQDYTWKLSVVIDHIGTTDLSSIVSQLSVPA